MMIQPGTAVWFAQHESRLAWRDWLSMMTAGRRERRRRLAIGIAIFVIVMHAVAYSVVGSFAAAPLDKQMLVGITVTLLLSWLLMVSQAMESMTRAFYARSDLDLILASPVKSHKVFAVRIATVALSVAMMALPLAAPFIDMLVVRGGARWLGAYCVIAAMGAAATALAVALTVALFRAIGPKRTRLVAQVVAAVIGAGFVIGLQVAAILSYGTMSRGSVLQSDAVLALAPHAASVLWWPARAVIGDGIALLAVMLASFTLLGGAIAMVAPRFGDYAIAAAGAENSPASRTRRPAVFRATSPRRALRRKEWLLLRRDPWLVSQTLMQMLYLVPPAVLLWRGFATGGGAFNLLVPVLVMAAGQLAGGLAWLAISGEDAPDLVATGAGARRGFILRAKIEAVLGVIARRLRAASSPRSYSPRLGMRWSPAAGIVIAASSATAIQLWFRSQAKRSQFRRRQVSSRVATFAEAFSSIAWAATAAVAAVNLWLAIAPGTHRAPRPRRRAVPQSAQKRLSAGLARRDQQNDDLAHLLERAEHIAGLTADLPQAQSRHQRDDDREHDHRHDRMRETKAGDQRKNSQSGGDGGRHRLRLADAGREPIAARRCNEEHQHWQDRARAGVRRDQRRRHQSRIVEACQRARPKQDRQDERADAVRADAAVAHDVEFLLAGLAAAEAVRGIGEAVLVQAPGRHERRGDGERGGRPGRQPQPVRHRVGDRTDDADDEAGDRQRPQRLRQRGARDRRGARQRQPRRKGNAGRELAEALGGPRPPVIREIRRRHR
jgi:ABC-2 type transport system permease protein